MGPLMAGTIAIGTGGCSGLPPPGPSEPPRLWLWALLSSPQPEAPRERVAMARRDRARRGLLRVRMDFDRQSWGAEGSGAGRRARSRVREVGSPGSKRKQNEPAGAWSHRELFFTCRRPGAAGTSAAPVEVRTCEEKFTVGPCARGFVLLPFGSR